MSQVITGKQLKRLRKRHGLSQTDIARYLEYDNDGKPNRSQISRFENGHTTINPRIGKLLWFFFEYEAGANESTN